MNKLFYKNIFVLSAAAILAVGAFIASVSRAFAEIPGKYLSADLGEADLLGIASKYPTLFWTTLIVFIVLCVGYGIYYFLKKKPG